MKKVIYLSTLVLIGIFTFISCENDTQNVNLKLTSPNGRVLANNLSQLNSLIIGNSKNLETNDIVLDKIKYFGNNEYSIAIIDYYVNSEFKSMLTTIELSDDYLMLTDKHSVQFVKKSSNSNARMKSDKLEYKDILINSISSRGVAHCQGKNCCSWEQTDPKRFNCGCGGGNAVIITTSDGCEVELE